ncbi:hypothetical protein [Winogradskyella sp. UBA3174]|uniref:hypothetical protein n=1 Tax=Winogradskyella sp. UBA3174 TaxID=1947785 RepID=UPI0025E5DFFC|nr:hypothetical protein [Winogradskyella sp. UBA3174]|tara:strand:- start:2892 stop:3320 length:429 start_codon:yes stop_codon:yes gene_type:complete
MIYISIKDFNSFTSLSNKGKIKVPEILFFNSNGYLVKNRFNNKRCTKVINEIEKIDSLKFNKKITINDWSENISPLNKDLTEKGTIFIIINWAKFVCKFNEESFDWYKELKKQNPNLKVNCIEFRYTRKMEFNRTAEKNIKY